MAGLSVMSGVASGQLVTAGDDGRGRGGEELGSFGKALLVESGKEAHTAPVAVGRAGRSHSLQPLLVWQHGPDVHFLKSMFALAVILASAAYLEIH